MKRTGLRRVACADCDLAVYSTVAALERGPLPCCPDHGALLPDDLELAFAVLGEADLARHPGVAEYDRERESIARGQVGPGLSLRRLGKPPLNDPSVLAEPARPRLPHGRSARPSAHGARPVQGRGAGSRGDSVLGRSVTMRGTETMRTTECPRCGQIVAEQAHAGLLLECSAPCAACLDAERAPQGEPVRLFEPAPSVIPGQLGL